MKEEERELSPAVMDDSFAIAVQPDENRRLLKQSDDF
jgi:hypothetical protein